LLNAAGRLADASLGVELLLAPDDASAIPLARRLRALNIERQRLTDLLEVEINSRILLEPPASVLFAVGNDWHLGLIGPAASRCASRYNRPAVIITTASGTSVARGSIRGNGHYDVLSALATQADILMEWGGHAGAAGFSIEDENIVEFKKGFSAAIDMATEGDRTEPLAIDAEIPWSSLNLADLGSESLYRDVSRLAPFSEGNPSPVLASRDLELTSKRPFGKDEAYADLIFADRNGRERVVKWWRHARSWRAAGRYDVAYTLAVDTWQGQSRVQLTLVAARPALQADDAVEMMEPQ
jgi:single-stranded-DNA-specific exonuclease